MLYDVTKVLQEYNAVTWFNKDVSSNKSVTIV